MAVLDFAIKTLIQHYTDTLEHDLPQRNEHLQLLNEPAGNYIFTAEVKEVREIADPKNKHLQQQSRYSDFLGIKEERFPTYNMNTVLPDYPHLIVAEGPTLLEDYSRFLANTVYNPPIRQRWTFVALGSPIEKGRSKYHQYYTGYKDKFEHIKQGFCDFLFENNSNDDKKPFDTVTVDLIQVPLWQDMETFRFSDEEVMFLYKLLDDNASHKVIHCSAGLGRSGTLLLAYAVFKELNNTLLTLSEEDAGAAFANKLIQMRQKRPGLVQTKDQLAMAIDLAYRFFNALQNQCEASSESKKEFQLLKAVLPPLQPFPEKNSSHCSTENLEESRGKYKI